MANKIKKKNTKSQDSYTNKKPSLHPKKSVSKSTRTHTDPKTQELPNNSQIIPEQLEKAQVDHNQSIKYPKNYRFITEKTLWIPVMCSIFIVGIAFFAQSIESQEKTKQKLIQQRSDIIASINRWQAIIEQHPNYRDAYIQLGREEYQIGDNQKAFDAVEKAKQLDPNNKNTIDIEKIIKRK